MLKESADAKRAQGTSFLLIVVIVAALSVAM